MASQPIDCDHANPVVNMVAFAAFLASNQILSQGTNLSKRVRVIKHQEIFRNLARLFEVNRPNALSDFLQSRRAQSRPCQDKAERVHVAPKRDAAQQCSFNYRSPPAHERIVNHLAGLSESFDEEARQLRFKAGSV